MNNSEFCNRISSTVLILFVIGIVLSCSDNGPTASNPGSDPDPPPSENPPPETFSAQFHDGKDAFRPGELVYIVVEGGTLTDEIYEGEVDSENIELLRSEDTSEEGAILILIVPPISEDSHELSWMIGEQELELNLRVKEYPEIDNKHTYLSSFVEDVLQSLEEFSREVSSTEITEWVEDLLEELNSSGSDFSEIDDQQLTTLAYLIQSNLKFWSGIDQPQSCSRSQDILDHVAKNIESGLVDMITVSSSDRLP
ncbi:MAG: hypothetical protein WD115_03285, partial [Balneolaceae bacterium]